MALQCRSPGLESGGPIPDRYTCEGDNISPPLQWTGAPPGTAAWVLIVDDPDAPSADGPFAHWLVYNLLGSASELPEGLGAGDIAGGGTQGRNSFGHDEYEGPCPPLNDDAHHYYFRLFALDAPLDLTAGATRSQIFNEMHGRVLAQTEFFGTFRRQTIAS